MLRAIATRVAPVGQFSVIPRARQRGGRVPVLVALIDASATLAQKPGNCSSTAPARICKRRSARPVECVQISNLIRAGVEKCLHAVQVPRQGGAMQWRVAAIVTRIPVAFAVREQRVANVRVAGDAREMQRSLSARVARTH